MCSVAHGKITIDSDRATVNDLVENILRSQLGYGEEFSMSNEVGTFYDPDLEDNLPKKLVDLGVKDGGFITIVDEEEEEPRVNLELIVSVPEKWVPHFFKEISLLIEPSLTNPRPDPSTKENPIILEKAIEIPRKSRAPEPIPNEQVNGVPSTESITGKRKRDAEEVGLVNGQSRAKRVAGIKENGDGSHPIVLDEDEGGAILLDWMIKWYNMEIDGVVLSVFGWSYWFVPNAWG